MMSFWTSEWIAPNLESGNSNYAFSSAQKHPRGKRNVRPEDKEVKSNMKTGLVQVSREGQIAS